MSRIPLRGWAAIAVGGLALLAIILYFFTIEEIELGIPPKVKFKRRIKTDEAEQKATAASPALQTIALSPPATSLEGVPVTEPAETRSLKPNLVHPYPLQANFTGRLKERQDLTAWLADDEHPICELVAMGGMGKSALTWVWLTQDVLKSKGGNLDGVMWWSFYEGESTFAKFVDEALKYVSDKPIDAELLPATYDRALELRKQLQNQRVLFVLDGFERQLRAYASLDAAYRSHEGVEPSVEARSCVDPITSRLLRDIAAVTASAKVLITSRLTVSDLEDRAGDPLAGVIERELKQLSRNDGIGFMRAQGVTKGTDAEIARACESYGYHALSLRLLSGLIEHDAKSPGDIKAAPRHDVHDDLIQRQHHVLQQSYDMLPRSERALLSCVAAFRGPMSYEAVSIFNTFGSEEVFEDALKDLRVRGFLQRDRPTNRYDLHPLVRQYAYDRLSDKKSVHGRLQEYFAGLPGNNEIEKLEDLANVIELYHHTLLATRHDEAWALYSQRLWQTLYYLFGAYQIQIELLRGLFDDESHPPRLKDKNDQGWATNVLANSYTRLGQNRSALRAFEIALGLAEELKDQSNLALVLGNMAMTQIPLGDLRSAEGNLQQSLVISQKIKDGFNEVVARRELGMLHAYSGRFDEVAEKLKVSLEYFQQRDMEQSVGITMGKCGEFALLKGDYKTAERAAEQAIDIAASLRAERDYIFGKWLLGAAAMRHQDLDSAQQHLTDALVSSRRITLVELEPRILLEWARWHRLKGNAQDSIEHANEALTIADRCEYRLVQADIHNFLAQLALDGVDRETARKEAEIAQERAWCDGPPHCYKPALDEAEKMLKEVGATQ